MASYTSSVYWGSGIDGEKFMKRLQNLCERRKVSLSELLKELVEKELKKDS